jgi:hypothetical protein
MAVDTGNRVVRDRVVDIMGLQGKRSKSLVSFWCESDGVIDCIDHSIYTWCRHLAFSLPLTILRLCSLQDAPSYCMFPCYKSFLILADLFSAMLWSPSGVQALLYQEPLPRMAGLRRKQLQRSKMVQSVW